MSELQRRLDTLPARESKPRDAIVSATKGSKKSMKLNAFKNLSILAVVLIGLAGVLYLVTRPKNTATVQIPKSIPNWQSVYTAAHQNLMNNRTYEALPVLEKLSAEHPENLDIQLDLSTAYLETRDFDKAIAVLVELDAARPDQLVVLHNLGTAFFKKGQHEQAQMYFIKALDIKPDNDPTRLQLARSYEKTKEWKKAYDVYTILKATSTVASPQLQERLRILRSLATHAQGTGDSYESL